MKESLFRSFALLFLCIVLVCQAAISFAWFSSTESADVSISGTSISNYFAGGDGSTDNPYIIKFPSNLYYLSWLQNLGRFEEKKYFKISDDITTLDMAGALNGGAIPPIGTEANPFLGEFRGNGKVIANLWVSSNPDDWYVQPAQEAFGDISMDGITDVGFFGYASQKSLEVVNEGDPSVIKAKINNFYLENLEITAHNTDTSVGLIAGYVDCDITAVGVKNGKITVKEASESITLTSDSSLFGKFGDHVYWEESPIGTIGGNKLLIDPNKDGDPFTGISTGYAQVPDSTQDSAFYVSSLGISTNGNTSANRYLYTNTVSWNHESTGTQTHTVGRPNSDLINPEVTDERINSSLWARMQSSMANFITPGDIYTGTGAARTLQTTTITVGGEELTVPKNGIWFKPRSGGICTLAMTLSNMSSGISISIYSYKRNADGSMGAINELKLNCPKTSGNPKWKNNDMVIVNVDIPKDTPDIDKYEFVIAKSSDATSVAGFLYLILAGTGTSGDEDDGSGVSQATLLKVDYVYKDANGAFPNMSAEDYTYNKVFFTLDTTVAINGNAEFCFNMKDNPTAAEAGKVYYTDSEDITNQLESENMGVPVSNNAVDFPPRMTEIPSS